MSKGHALGCTGHTEEGWCIPAVDTTPLPTHKKRVEARQCTWPMLLDVDEAGKLWAYCEHSEWAEELALPATPTEVQAKSRLHIYKCPARRDSGIG